MSGHRDSGQAQRDPESSSFGGTTCAFRKTRFRHERLITESV
jgi:hypothetical protein